MKLYWKIIILLFRHIPQKELDEDEYLTYQEKLQFSEKSHLKNTLENFEHNLEWLVKWSVEWIS